MKIVINRCVGFFGISNEALIRLVERDSSAVAGLRDEGDYERWYGPGRGFDISLRDGFFAANAVDGVLKDGVRYILDYETPRTDPDLIAVIEEMGEESAIPDYSNLVVVTIPDGVDWYIHEEHHDCCECEGNGMESIHEVHRVWTGGANDPQS